MRREIWHGRPWLGTVVFVVEDSPDLLVSYLPEGAPFGFADGDWPGPTGATRGAMLERGERWWDATWASWEPDRSWRSPTLPAGWELV